MMAGKSGFGTYTMNGVEKYLAYAPVINSEGWSLGVNAPISELMGAVNSSIAVTVGMLIVFVLITLIVAMWLANGIGKPLRNMARDLMSIAETGKVDIGPEAMRQERLYSQKDDEIGVIAKASLQLIEMLSLKIVDLDTIANGDLSLDVARNSEEDAIGNALITTVDNLNRMFSEIRGASVQVSSGAGQVSDDSQILARGSMEQSASVEQLSVTIKKVAGKTSDNTDMAKKAAALSETIKESAQKGSSLMEQMMAAVRDIDQASNSINKVIKVIDDIAFQTNILALNAAVEAARAGQHGKGFAVVADEVRNLAAKSAEAAKDTGGLISDSIEKSKLGYKIATETSGSLNEIVAGIDQSAEIITQIADLSLEQADAIAQINNGIERVAHIVQQNSATAQQSAAAAEEMHGQSETLQQLVMQFRLKEGGDESVRALNP